MTPTANGDQLPASPSTPRASSRGDRQARFAQTFANVIAVLMRDPGFRNLRLAELEWLVLPPIMSGQWQLAQSAAPTPAGKSEAEVPGSIVVPVAVALWASVSAEIDTRLSSRLDKPLALKPNEWVSGDNLWMVVVAGDPRAVPKFLKQLAATQFKGRRVKLRANGPDGKVMVTTLEAHSAVRSP